MSLFDKLANAGRGSRMSDAQLSRAKGQAQNTNELNALAHVASGYGGNNQGATDAERRIAEGVLMDKVGRRKAEKLMKEARHRVRDSF